ncbi:MAG TPA: hypothetical protein VFB45_12175 [Pseudolabrys sp.]|nr:hypothetical protein [Pseudolabrys sp.]
MRFRTFAAIVAALGACALLSAPADAAPRKKVRVVGAGHTLYVVRGEDGRTRTRIIVQRRSYLDAGTEVLPGERKYTDYVLPPNYETFSVLPGSVNHAGFQNPKWPLPGPFDLMSNHAP